MSQIKNASNAKMTALFSAGASFIGMMAAVPVSLALFSNAPQAQAMQQPQTDSYAQYAKAYTDGYLSSMDGQEVGSCAEPQGSTASMKSSSAPVATAASYHAKKSPMHKKSHKKPMTKMQWQKNISNSYNHYISVTNNKTEVKTKNINSNNTIGSNNTTTSSVSVSDSNGAVVSNNTATNGSNFSHTDVDNMASNNTVTVKDSFNKTDSHDKKIVVKDSGNTTTTTTTNNTTVINDSFNKKTNVDVDVDLNSHNKVYVKHDELHL